ncbi:MAG: DUF4190 domain-containing protein [Acutalibacteraceae bacterium]
MNNNYNGMPQQPQQPQYQQPQQPQYQQPVQPYVQYPQPVQPMQPAQQMYQQVIMQPMIAIDSRSKGLGTASLVLGIISVVTCWLPVIPVVLAVIGLICSVKARNGIPYGIPGRGVATAGLVLSIIGLVFGSIYLCCYACACSSASTVGWNNYRYYNG